MRKSARDPSRCAPVQRRPCLSVRLWAATRQPPSHPCPAMRSRPQSCWRAAICAPRCNSAVSSVLGDRQSGHQQVRCIRMGTPPVDVLARGWPAQATVEAAQVDIGLPNLHLPGTLGGVQIEMRQCEAFGCRGTTRRNFAFITSLRAGFDLRRSPPAVLSRQTQIDILDLYKYQ